MCQERVGANLIAVRLRKPSHSHALRGNASWTLCVLCIGRPRYKHRGRRASHMRSNAERGNENKWGQSKIKINGVVK